MKKSVLKTILVNLGMVVVLGSSAANSATYSWSGGLQTGPFSPEITYGGFDQTYNLTVAYNNDTKDLSLSARWKTNESADGAPEGAWIALGDGSPNGLSGNVPVFYLDWKTGFNRVTSYVYDDITDAAGAYLGSWDNKISAVNSGLWQDVSLTLNLAQINAYAGGPTWTGGAFSTNVAVRFRYFDQVPGDEITYTTLANGANAIFSVPSYSGYVDSIDSGLLTTCVSGATKCPNATGGGKVPLPPTLSLLALGAFGLRRLTQKIARSV